MIHKNFEIKILDLHWIEDFDYTTVLSAHGNVLHSYPQHFIYLKIP